MSHHCDNAATWWYLDQLRRKQRSLESDLEWMKALLERADTHSKPRLQRELEFIETQLAKVKRGLLY